VRAQPLVTRFVACAFAVLSTIDFYNEPLFPAYKVGHISANRMLANKFVTGEARP
jgi:hypothetical protein